MRCETHRCFITKYLYIIAILWLIVNFMMDTSVETGIMTTHADNICI